MDANTLNTIHELDSVIMNHMISNEIKTSVDDIPNSAYIDQDPQNDVKPEEISKLIASLEILDEPISGLGTLKTNQLTFDKLSDIDALNSSIIDRLISNGLKDSTVIMTDNALDSEGHVSKDEITNFIEAINMIDDVNTVDEFIVYIENLTMAELPTLLVLATSDSRFLKILHNIKLIK